MPLQGGWSWGWDQAGAGGWVTSCCHCGWDFPPDAVVRAGWGWVLGTAPGWGALEMMVHHEHSGEVSFQVLS